jgi:hypothetical protein
VRILTKVEEILIKGLSGLLALMFSMACHHTKSIRKHADHFPTENSTHLDGSRRTDNLMVPS